MVNGKRRGIISGPIQTLLSFIPRKTWTIAAFGLDANNPP
jgi:hypothetical protein